MIGQATQTHRFGIPLACLILLGGSPAAGQELSTPIYRIKTSEVVVPPDIPMGQYQRIIRPFENWTLICDENLKERKKVCNITQVIEDQAGNSVFSWSLAATEAGKPYFLLRAPPNMPSDGKVSLYFDGRQNPVDVSLQGCNETVCIAMVPVGPILRGQIAKAANPKISFPTVSGETTTVTTSLAGLDKALAAIN